MLQASFIATEYRNPKLYFQSALEQLQFWLCTHQHNDHHPDGRREHDRNRPRNQDWQLDYARAHPRTVISGCGLDVEGLYAAINWIDELDRRQPPGFWSMQARTRRHRTRLDHQGPR